MQTWTLSASLSMCRTPCQGKVYDALPLESRTTYVQLLAPKAVSGQAACVMHLAGTGDHGFERRLRLGAPLLSKVSTKAKCPSADRNTQQKYPADRHSQQRRVSNILGTQSLASPGQKSDSRP